MIDITLGSFGLPGFKSWKVSSEPFLSDHRHTCILLIVDGFLQVRLIRNPRGTNWNSFQDGLKRVLDGAPEIKIKDEAGLGRAILSVQQALMRKTVPLIPARTGKHV